MKECWNKNNHVKSFVASTFSSLSFSLSPPVRPAEFLRQPPSAGSRAHGATVLREHPAQRRLAEARRRRHPRLSTAAQGSARLSRPPAAAAATPPPFLSPDHLPPYNRDPEREKRACSQLAPTAAAARQSQESSADRLFLRR